MFAMLLSALAIVSASDPTIDGFPLRSINDTITESGLKTLASRSEYAQSIDELNEKRKNAASKCEEKLSIKSSNKSKANSWLITGIVFSALVTTSSGIEQGLSQDKAQGFNIASISLGGVGLIATGLTKLFQDRANEFATSNMNQHLSTYDEKILSARFDIEQLNYLLNQQRQIQSESEQLNAAIENLKKLPQRSESVQAADSATIASYKTQITKLDGQNSKLNGEITAQRTAIRSAISNAQQALDQLATSCDILAK